MVSKNSTSTMAPRKMDSGRTRIRPVKRQMKTRGPPQQPVVFGPVATIDTAPVAIGNSVSGSEPVVTHMKDGVRIRGRDFFLNIDAVQSGLSGWYLVGGAPLVPHALTSSLLKSYAGIYANYVVHGMAFHFITAVGTGTQGDVAMMINKSVADPIIDSSSNNFLSVLLSDKNTVFGPLWKNHTAVFHPPPRVYNTDMLNDEDLDHRGPGELLIFTRSSVEQTPGYVLMDYDITFRTMQVNIRALTFPITKMKYHQTGIGTSSTPVTIGDVALMKIDGFTLDGSAATPPVGIQLGDIYKVVFNLGIKTLNNVTLANLFGSQLISGNTSVVIDPMTITYGTTIYASTYQLTGSPVFTFYPTFEAAKAQSKPLVHNVTDTISAFIPAHFSFVGTVGDTRYTQTAI